MLEGFWLRKARKKPRGKIRFPPWFFLGPSPDAKHRRETSCFFSSKRIRKRGSRVVAALVGCGAKLRRRLLIKSLGCIEGPQPFDCNPQDRLCRSEEQQNVASYINLRP
jgi:hypothetical protein